MLELENISLKVKSDNGDKEILKNISLKIDAPFTVITGPNGGGKSSLARVIAGIYTPDEGRILLNGEDITNMSITERAKKGISFAFQTPVKFKGIKVIDLLQIAAKKELTVSDACSYLSSVGLCARDYINREVNGSLSGGELKRIEIATVLARESEISLFDEPEAGIDLWSFGSLINVFENMRKKVNGSIVIISHQERILGIADKIIVISGGKLEKVGTRDEVLPGLLCNGVCKALEI